MLDQERDYEAFFDNLSEKDRIVEAPEQRAGNIQRRKSTTNPDHSAKYDYNCRIYYCARRSLL